MAAEPPDGPALEISAALARQLREAAEAAYPEEGCGFLLGSRAGGRARVERLLPARNRETESRAHRYRVDAAQYFEAERAARDGGLEILGLYHSHPDSPPIPSSIDSEFAFPGWVYWITQARGGGAGQARAWLRAEDAAAWIPLRVAET